MTPAARHLPAPRGTHLWLYFPVYFWAGVIFAAVATLAFILLRRFRARPAPGRIQQNPHA